MPRPGSTESSSRAYFGLHSFRRLPEDGHQLIIQAFSSQREPRRQPCLIITYLPTIHYYHPYFRYHRTTSKLFQQSTSPTVLAPERRSNEELIRNWSEIRMVLTPCSLAVVETIAVRLTSLPQPTLKSLLYVCTVKLSNTIENSFGTLFCIAKLQHEVSTIQISNLEAPRSETCSSMKARKHNAAPTASRG